MPALIIQTGPQAGTRFEIDGDVVVGRGDVDCVINDPELSRRHLTVRVTPTGVEVEDLGSLNGTWFKGKRVVAATVIPGGAVIRIGETELVVELATPAEASSRPVVSPAPRPEATAESSDPPPTNVPIKPARPTAAPPAAEAPPPPPSPPDAVKAPTVRRLLVPVAMTLLTIFATVIALLVYFATR